MKYNPFFRLEQSNANSLRLKEKILTNMPFSQSKMTETSSRKSITQNNFFQPQLLHQKHTFASNNSQEYSRIQTSRPSQTIQNPEKVKSSSVHQKIAKPNTKIQYLSYAHRHYKQQKQGNVNFTSIIESQHRLKDDLQQIKSKLQIYYEELQKKDEAIRKKQKQLSQTSKNLEIAIQRIHLLETKCHELQHNNHALYDQCMRYQETQEYNSKLFDNYRILSQKCAQIQQILQQKDAYIDNIITTKNYEYYSAINTKNYEIKTLQQRINILQEQNNKLLVTIKNQNNNQQNSKEIDVSKFQAIGQQFETKVNFYIDESILLKNVIGRYQGQIQELKVQVNSLQNTLKAYEDRDKLQKVSRLQEELQMLRNALENEKMEKDELISRHELQIMKMENILSTKRLESEGQLINLYDKQRLRQSLYWALQDVSRLTKKLNENNVLKV